MKSFFLSRRINFYFWTGLAVAIGTILNLGTGYSNSEYARKLYPMVNVTLLLLAGLLALFFFWSQQRDKGALESGCFAGITTALVVFNLLFNFLPLLVFS